MKHFLRINDFNPKELETVLDLSLKVKKELKTKGRNKPVLAGQTLVCIYEKPSLRTRISFDIGMHQFGGYSIYLGPSDIQMGERESASDIGRVSSSMADIIMARTFKHQTIVELSKGSSVPVINGLSDFEHPCQVLADFLTIKEQLKRVNGLKIVFVGDGNNNVTHSLAIMSAMLGNQFVSIAPKGYEMDPKILKDAQAYPGEVVTTDDMSQVRNADVVVTDTWVSMGDEAEKETRLKVFGPYQVTKKVMKMAKPSAIFMHCLPAYRGKEVAADVIDGPQSVVFAEAENRLHAQKGLILFLKNINY